MTSNFNDAAIAIIIDKLMSYAMASGRFDTVNGHEPKSGPGRGIHCSVWMQTITPATRSGLAATSGLLVFNVRVYMSFLSQPFDAIDPAVMAAMADFMGALSGDFEFGQEANVRMVDLLGSNGIKMGATAGYVEIERAIYRVRS